MKIALFYSSGIGNALLTIPLVEQLKKEGHTLYAICCSPFNSEQVFLHTNYFAHFVKLKNAGQQAKYLAKYSRNKFDLSLVDFFSSSKKNLFLASLTSKLVKSNHPIQKSFFQRKNIEYSNLQQDIHETQQYLYLYNNNTNFNKLQSTFPDFKIPKSPKNFNLPTEYIVVQTSSGNSTAPYKNWSKDNWKQLFTKLKTESLNFVLIGDSTEIEWNEYFESIAPNVINLTGKTTIIEALYLIQHSKGYLGLDSGFMHAAAFLNKPTVTIWGGSNYNMYGYGNLHPNLHTVLKFTLPCWPCNAYVNPNTSRVTIPNECPDFKCIQSVSVSSVQQAVLEKFK